MIFTIEKESILSIISLAQSISEQNNINSYFSFLILRAKKDSLVIQSADRQSTFEHIIHVNDENNLTVKEEGATLLPIVKIYNIVQNFPDGFITFELKKEAMEITPQENPSEISFSIRIRPIEDYPSNIHKKISKESQKINSKEFYKLIHNTSFAVSSENKDTFLFLTGIFFEIKDNFLISVATDRNRISIAKTKVDFSFNNEKDIIVPSKIMTTVKRLLSTLDEDITLAIDEQKMYLTIGNSTISINLISGKYYDYTKIIPKQTRNKIIVDKEILKTTLNRVSLIGDTKKNTAVKFTIEDKALTITSEEKEQGFSKEKIPIDIDGKVTTFSVKAQFIYDPLQVIKGEKVTIDYGLEERDLIKITSLNDENIIHITAPFNI